MEPEGPPVTSREFIDLINRHGGAIAEEWELDAVDFTPAMERLTHEHVLELDDLGLVERLLGCSQHFRAMLPRRTLLALYEAWDDGSPEVDTLRGFIVQLLGRFRSAEVGRWAAARILDKELGDHRFYMAPLVAKGLPSEESTELLERFYAEMPLAAVPALGIRGGERARLFLHGVALSAEKPVQHEIIKALGRINRRLGIPR